jgi:hypothetical protein
MRLTFIGKDPRSNPTGSPAVYITDDRTLIVQGYVITQEARADMKPIPGGEDAVELPVRMVPDVMRAFLAIYERAAGPDTIKRPTEENRDLDVVSIHPATDGPHGGPGDGASQAIASQAIASPAIASPAADIPAPGLAA